MAGAGSIALSPEQRAGSAPDAHVWLSASAGTGKTSVLSARVLRLLLQGVRPETTLCLTFTKAAAAEMANRIQAQLTKWVRMPGPELHAELVALGEAGGPAMRETARTLFAKVLDAPGGLRILTIHSFCQSLLAAFPAEAGLSPGFRAIEGGEQARLQREVLTALLVGAERTQPRLIDDLRLLALRMGEGGVIDWLRRTASSLDALEALGPGLEAKVRASLGVPRDWQPSDLAAACADNAIDREELLAVAAMQVGWGTPTGEKNADRVANWLLGTPTQRARELAQLRCAWATQQGTMQKNGPKDPAYAALAVRLDAWCAGLIERADRAALADTIAAALRAAQAYARAYADAKTRVGVVDFDDMIARTLALLREDGMGAWIRYKLDQALDHILVDEAQDTNAAQWAIVRALTGEFWAGEGAKGDNARTLFTVGDFKQAIFGFQGTDPRFYEAARELFHREAQAVDDALQRLSLTQSYRSSPPVLAVVDAVMDALGPEAVGIDDIFEPHVSFKGGPGQVLLLPPVPSSGEDDSDEDDGEEGFFVEADRVLARRIAQQVRRWIDADVGLVPGDVMILCRKRGSLAALIVARLIEEGIAVAGVDRLRLAAPLAVQDLMAAVRFALQPHDDLNLAALLVSPLIGWTQDELFEVAHDRQGSLWQALPEGLARNALRDVLAIADLTTPARFLETLLSGPMHGRRKLLARLGEEARDPIEELMNTALAFEAQGVATLQGFVDWFDRDATEIKRDPDAAGSAVRVMTVHAAKGLQAPLVILADACGNPDNVRENAVQWQIEGLADALPMFRPRGAERTLVASLASAVEDAEKRARCEHWRLLYVAMTRAERMLVVAGRLGKRDKEAAEASWHARIATTLQAIGARQETIDPWGDALVYGDVALPFAPPALKPETAPPIERPDWIDQPAPLEARPPRPLAPSSLGADDVATPPPGAHTASAARRGRTLHALFERLPSLPPATRRAAGLRIVPDDPDAVDTVLALIETPDFAPLFAPEGLAEVPLAGVVEGVVVAGTVDRLLITSERVTVLDYKTGRRVPQGADAIPAAHLRQMAAYVAVLRGIYPDRAVNAMLLYTEGPVLHRVPDAVLEAYKPGFAAAEDMLGAGS